MTNKWKVDLFSLATTAGVFYILCAIFDALFPPFGLIAAVSTHSPWPLFWEPARLLERICDVRHRWSCAGRALRNCVGFLERKTARAKADITKDR